MPGLIGRHISVGQSSVTFAPLHRKIMFVFYRLAVALQDHLIDYHHTCIASFAIGLVLIKNSSASARK